MTIKKSTVKGKCFYAIMLQEQRDTYSYGQFSEVAISIPAVQSFVSAVQVIQI